MSNPHTQRLNIGNHTLLPSSNRHSQLPDHVIMNILPTQSFISWILGRGTVIWRIWPAVLLHTVFAAVVVTISLKTKYDLGIPSVLITVLGVVIGFVISYRASSGCIVLPFAVHILKDDASVQLNVWMGMILGLKLVFAGYDRYWAGRSSWTDIFRNARTFSRMIWFHIPLRVSTPTEGVDLEQEAERVMREKIIALDLVEGFVISLKHHLRGEMGIYYEDLYTLVKPLHDHPHHRHRANLPLLNGSSPNADIASSTSAVGAKTSSLSVPVIAELPAARENNHYIPPVNSYGSFRVASHIQSSIANEAHLGHHDSRDPYVTKPLEERNSRSSSRSSEREPLLPNQDHGSSRPMERIKGDLVPFAGVFKGIFGWMVVEETENVEAPNSSHIGAAGVKPPKKKTRKRKDRPLIAGGGYNIPLEVLRSLSDWVAELEARGTVPGASLGSLLGCIQSFETSLAALEQVLTTPLPFVYSVHISTVWFYLFSLPFQLVQGFEWFTIPGVAIAAFIYLGFLTAGEEIEQPFGYDENDLDLDLFCRAIVHAEIEQLKHTQARNASSMYGKQRESPSNSVHDLANASSSAQTKAPVG